MQNSYESKQKFKYFFFVTAILIAITSILVTNSLVKKLAQEEHKKVAIWAEAIKLFAKQTTGTEPQTNLDENAFNEYDKFVLHILEDNTTIPLLLVDSDGNSVSSPMNIDSARLDNPESIKKLIKKFSEKNTPIKIDTGEGMVQSIYYDESTVLKQLKIFPYVQLSVVTIFIIVSFLALTSSKKAEQNKIWVGLSKETAHQLGTPISSLMAWIEYLKTKNPDVQFLDEMDKDVHRLKIIAERFSKIGSNPAPIPMDLDAALKQIIDYMGKRISSKVSVNYHPAKEPVHVVMNDSLFGWVIENLIKNAVDAMDGKGKIDIVVTDSGTKVKIDVSDTGKGIPKSKHEAIFHPGYTTKTRGWGLGLSLVKRIVESYQKGKIYVSNSEINKGTTFRIELSKA
ncbi:MAG: HAMP domain-containing histidine kinase [Dysgonamonadaceae bacterium]|jgi:two-component sensor histidine kinase|nr:HAMP domain-containing histidine kinase [Dysgonamonadaceae bacterium]